MLKKYLQALLEAFIGSKKEWVAHQVGGDHSSITIAINKPAETTFIAPSDGWIHIEVTGSDRSDKTNFINIVTDTPNSSWRSSVCRSSNAGVIALCIYARKGDSHNIYFSAEKVIVCHFIPCIGSV